MKKLVLLLAVVFSVSMFSCGSSDKAAATDADSAVVVEEVTEVVETVVPDSVAAADSVVAAADSVVNAQ